MFDTMDKNFDWFFRRPIRRIESLQQDPPSVQSALAECQALADTRSDFNGRTAQAITAALKGPDYKAVAINPFNPYLAFKVCADNDKGEPETTVAVYNDGHLYWQATDGKFYRADGPELQRVPTRKYIDILVLMQHCQAIWATTPVVHYQKRESMARKQAAAERAAGRNELRLNHALGLLEAL